MWFRNLQLYRFAQAFDLASEVLEERLAGASFTPCESLDQERLGWVPPLGRNGQLLSHVAGACTMVCLRKQEKVLPSAAVKERLEERVEALEAESGRSVGRKWRESLKDEVLLDLLPRALTRSRLTYAYLAPAAGWLVVDAASPAQAEELIEHLREVVGSLPVAPLAVNDAPASVMTRWLTRDELPANFSVEDECELRDTGDEGAIVRCRRQDLYSDEIQGHLKAGKQVVRVAINWADRLTGFLSEDLSVKRLRFSDDVLAAADAEGDAASRFDSDFALMTLELSRFLEELVAAFGGEDQAVLDRAIPARVAVG